ncbi:conserved hypothetical protein, secreted [Candidatus Magnetomorum sp. HK-1]|nr:conserved hypothetical protein, secreted [Candidatus Magnetomorum sp. HK-1]
MKLYYIFISFFCVLHATLCNSAMIYADTATFGQSINLGLIECNELNEASGLSMSHQYTNVLWSHNDSGDKSRLYAMSTNGKHLATFQLKDVEAIDWEDIACGPGPNPDISYIYIADIGDNKAKRKAKYIYRLQEPSLPDLSHNSIIQIPTFDSIEFSYPDGKRDSETLMIDPATRDIYIVSKREKQVNVYRLAYPQSLNYTIWPDKVATLPFSWAVGGDISPDGNEMLIKTDDTVFYWKKADNESINKFFSTPNLRSVPYTIELQGEAICWNRKSMGYFTVSEEPWRIENNDAHLMFYPRLTLMDMNQDQQFDIADIMYLFEYIADLRMLPDNMPVLPDINFNNRVFIEELIYGLQMLILRVQVK